MKIFNVIIFVIFLNYNFHAPGMHERYPGFIQGESPEPPGRLSGTIVYPTFIDGKDNNRIIIEQEESSKKYSITFKQANGIQQNIAVDDTIEDQYKTTFVTLKGPFHLLKNKNHVHYNNKVYMTKSSLKHLLSDPNTDFKSLKLAE